MPIFKFLCVFITEQFSLFENVLYDYIAMAIVGAIAFSIAYGMVGKLYRLDIIDGRFIGSLLHWIIRLIVFVALFLFVSIVFWIAKLIIAVSAWMWLTLLEFGLISVVSYIATKKILSGQSN